MNTVLKVFLAAFIVLGSLAISDTSEVYAQKRRSKKEKKEKEDKPDKKSRRSKDKGDGLSKDEERALKKELKSYKKNLESYQAYKDRNNETRAELGEVKTELARVKQLEADCNKEVEGLRGEIEDLMAKLDACKASKSENKGFSVPTSGLYYVVQIGAFENADAPTNNNNPDFRKENDNGMNKYIMGVFNSVDDADALRNFLYQIDFRRNPNYRPFVVPYRDGQRISIEDALGPDEAQRRRQMMGQ